MAIITKPVTVNRGEAAEISLSTSDLASHSDVAADGYFSSTSVWQSVSLTYKSDTRDQKEVVQFNLSDGAVSRFLVSQYSVGNFLIQNLTINDFDGGKKVLERASLTTNDFDIIFS